MAQTMMDNKPGAMLDAPWGDDGAATAVRYAAHSPADGPTYQLDLQQFLGGGGGGAPYYAKQQHCFAEDGLRGPLQPLQPPPQQQHQQQHVSPRVQPTPMYQQPSPPPQQQQQQQQQQPVTAARTSPGALPLSTHDLIRLQQIQQLPPLGGAHKLTEPTDVHQPRQASPPAPQAATHDPRLSPTTATAHRFASPDGSNTTGTLSAAASPPPPPPQPVSAPAARSGPPTAIPLDKFQQMQLNRSSAPESRYGPGPVMTNFSGIQVHVRNTIPPDLRQSRAPALGRPPSANSQSRRNSVAGTTAQRGSATTAAAHYADAFAAQMHQLSRHQQHATAISEIHTTQQRRGSLPAQSDFDIRAAVDSGKSLSQLCRAAEVAASSSSTGSPSSVSSASSSLVHWPPARMGRSPHPQQQPIYGGAPPPLHLAQLEQPHQLAYSPTRAPGQYVQHPQQYPQPPQPPLSFNHGAPVPFYPSSNGYARGGISGPTYPYSAVAQVPMDFGPDGGVATAGGAFYPYGSAAADGAGTGSAATEHPVGAATFPNSEEAPGEGNPNWHQAAPATAPTLAETLQSIYSWQSQMPSSLQPPQQQLQQHNMLQQQSLINLPQLLPAPGPNTAALDALPAASSSPSKNRVRRRAKEEDNTVVDGNSTATDAATGDMDAAAPPPPPPKRNRSKRSRGSRGNKTFSCPECEKMFNRLEHVKRHMLMHSGERPYQCTACFKLFSRTDNLQQHQKTHARPPRSVEKSTKRDPSKKRQRKSQPPKEAPAPGEAGEGEDDEDCDDIFMSLPPGMPFAGRMGLPGDDDDDDDSSDSDDDYVDHHHH